MSKLQSLSDILEEELKDLYDAEMQLTKAMPKIMKRISSESVKQAFDEHMKVTQQQVARLEKVSEMLDFKISGMKCRAMQGLIEECDHILKEHDADSPFLDALIIGAAQKIEHYEISGYGTARALADSLELDDAADLLQQTLDEESVMDEKLTAVSEEEVLPACMDSEIAGSSEIEEGAAPAKGKKKPSSKQDAQYR